MQTASSSFSIWPPLIKFYRRLVAASNSEGQIVVYSSLNCILKSMLSVNKGSSFCWGSGGVRFVESTISHVLGGSSTPGLIGTFIAMSSQTLLSKPPRTPASQRTRSNIGYKLHSPLKQHKPILQPLNVHLHSSSHHKAPSSPFTLSVDLKPTPFMPPKAGSTTTRDAAKRKATKQNTLNFQKTRPIGSTLVPATLSAAQTRAKRAHSPHSSPDPDDAPAKRFKPEVSRPIARVFRPSLIVYQAASLGAEVETASSGGSLVRDKLNSYFLTLTMC